MLRPESVHEGPHQSHIAVRGDLIERGHPSVQVGTVFDAAVLCGVPLFAADPAERSRLADAEKDRVALLPRRVRQPRLELSDDF